MKRIVASIGAAAIGSTAIQQAQAVDLTPQESSKPWSVGVALRGFYDDNYLLVSRDAPGGTPESWGFEVRPTVGLNIPLEQTYFGLDLTYSGEWYENDSQWNNSFLANALLTHAFSERITLDVQDRFVYSDRPELLDPTLSTTIRTDQSNISNRGNVQLAFGLSPRLGLVLAYQNLFWDYENENPSADTIAPPIGQASLSARLDRIEQTIPINLRHQTGPATTTLIGYSYGMVDYTSNEYLYQRPLGSLTGPKADTRNNRSHYGYIGVEHNFSPLLNLGARGGFQYTDYYNDSNTGSQITPYGDISLMYFYTKGSSVEAGYTLSQAATDVLAPTLITGDVTQNRLASSLFARVTHQFLPNFRGSLYGQWQLSQYNGGFYDTSNENLYLFGASLSYDINRFLAADIGYKFDYMDSDVPGRDYTRNRVHIGLTATY